MILAKRLLILIWIPPIFGFFLAARDTLIFALFINGPTAIAMAITASFAFLLVPSLICWALLESAWRWGGSKSKNRFTIISVGGVIWGIAFLLMNVLVHRSGAWETRAASYLLVGLACGTTVSALIFPKSRLTESNPQSSAGLSFLRSAGLTVAIVAGSAGLLGIGLLIARWHQFHLPSDRYVRKYFADHHEEYVHFVTLLRRSPSIQNVSLDGEINSQPFHAGRSEPEFRDLMTKIGAKTVAVRDDNAIEFELWGSGGAIISDSFKGIRFTPDGPPRTQHPGWPPTTVASLADDKLPHDKNGIVSGYYILPIDSNWSIYRFEYQE